MSLGTLWRHRWRRMTRYVRRRPSAARVGNVQATGSSFGTRCPPEPRAMPDALVLFAVAGVLVGLYVAEVMGAPRREAQWRRLGTTDVRHTVRGVDDSSDVGPASNRAATKVTPALSAPLASQASVGSADVSP